MSINNFKNETFEEKKKRALKIYNILKKEFKNAKIQLNFSNEYELLFAVILSAQCTDERVNLVTKKLFKRYKTLKDYANADLKELESIIKSTGYYKQKALRIKNSAKLLLEKYNGKIPNDIEELIKLPGVGRKTANVVLQNFYDKTQGVVVDTHVKRISKRLCLTKNNDPEKIEEDLMKLYDKKYWKKLSDYFIFFGRKTCKAIKPDCKNCKLYSYCYYDKKEKFKNL